MESLTKTCCIGLLAALSLCSANAVAAPATPGPVAPSASETSGPEADLEIDPTAYALDGYSLHVGVNEHHWRLDLGAFALAVPEFVHGNSDFAVSFHGYGAKLQYFFGENHAGGFVGMDAGHIRMLAQRKGSDLATTDDSVSVGVHVGYRIDIFHGFYVKPWIGVSYGFGSEDVTLGGETLEAQPITVFPAIHLGYAFE
ncbi:MAG: hypothetical protein KC766_03345 [Myxococcales bacterium]|nr:hypothetical protein [Myxococcales bacterium]